jgi:steroid delta-isomerase-like uncharacterized protein
VNAVRDVLDELFRAAGDGDLERVLALWDDDGVLEDVTLGRRAAGKDAVARYLNEYFRAFPDLSYSPEEIWTAKDRGVVTWAGTSHPAGSFFGIPMPAAPLHLRGVDLFVVRDDRVLHERSWYGDGWLFHPSQ